MKKISEFHPTHILVTTKFDNDVLEYYQIVLKNGAGARATIDKDDNLVAAINSYCAVIRKSLQLSSKGIIVFPSGQGKKAITLVAFVDAYYNGFPLDEIGTAPVRRTGNKSLPDGSEDCRRDSLTNGRGVQLKTRSRRFMVTEPIDGIRYVNLYLNKFKKPFWLDHSDRLLYLLANTEIFNNFHISGNYVQTGLHPSIDCDYPPRLGPVCNAIYEGLLSADNVDRIQEIILTMNKGGTLHIDHLNSDLFNYCGRNLSPMTKSENDAKACFTAQFFGQYSVTWAYDRYTGHYLLELKNGATATARHIVCTDVDHLLDCLVNLLGKNSARYQWEYYTVKGNNSPLLVPTPKVALQHAKAQYRASGGIGRVKSTIDTKEDLMMSGRLLNLYRTSPKIFTMWPLLNSADSCRHAEIFLNTIV